MSAADCTPSAGHHLLPVCAALGEREAAAQITQDITDLHADHARDASDTIMTAFQAGTYTKVGTHCRISVAGLSCLGFTFNDLHQAGLLWLVLPSVPAAA